MTINEIYPIAFLGIADNTDFHGTPYPIGNVDILELSYHKRHLIYPAATRDNIWLFMVHRSCLFDEGPKEPPTVRITHEKLGKLADVKLSPILKDTPGGNKEKEFDAGLIPIPGNLQWSLIQINLDISILMPGKCLIQAIIEDSVSTIGEANFHYSPTPQLTPDQIKAIMSDPTSPKSIMLRLGCKDCQAELLVYAALSREPELENDGYIFHPDLESRFHCECGKTDYSLEHIKESLHGLLAKRMHPFSEKITYIKKYSSQQVLNTIRRFSELLDEEKDEESYQKYIENHLNLLARFEAKSIWFKPTIMGIHNADFAIMDSRDRLLLIEIEEPSIPLFRKNGHPRAELMSAYGQIQDWMNKYSKYPAAVLENFGLTQQAITTVKGILIAGRKKNCRFDHLQRHLMNPPYDEIDFLTYDDLMNSLLEISKSLF
jgi:hypothetical protein